MVLIDSHIHLYSSPLAEGLPALLETATAAGIQRFYMPAIDSETHHAMHAVEAAHPHTCFAMMGLHPCSVQANWEAELALVEKNLFSRHYVAVGEIGLDLHWDKTFAHEQAQAFERQMQWALELGLPINIHSREATASTLQLVKPFASKGLKGIFHCFGGSLETAQAIIGMGFLLGIGGVLTYKKSGLAEVMAKIDLQHVVLETDAPYLTPVPHRGKPNMPAYLSIIASKLAEVKGISVEELASVTAANTLQLYKHEKA